MYIYECTCICVNVCVYVCMYVCRHIYECKTAYACICVYACIHIYTFIHSFIHSEDLYSASPRDYYSEVLPAQSRRKKDFGPYIYMTGGFVQREMYYSKLGEVWGIVREIVRGNIQGRNVLHST